jgi:hypothetical protein
MSKKKPRRIKARLPQEAQAVLRTRGGAHGTNKGERGYNRAAEKQKLQNLLSTSKPAPPELAFLLNCKNISGQFLQNVIKFQI